MYEDSKPGTLNDFLGAMTEDDVRPEVLRRFERMVDEVARNAADLVNGKYGTVSPFTVSPEMLAVAKAAKRQEIETWRTEQETQSFTFEWNGRTWNAGPDSLARLYPVVMAAKSDTARTALAWGDADNQQVKLSMPELEELAAAMAQAQVDRNDEIYQRQRELKEELSSLGDLNSVRNFIVE